MTKYKKIAFLFPGQGAQYPGMGKDFVETYKEAREVFEEADDILKKKLSSIILNGPESVLTETRNSQTGIYVMSMALLRVLEQNFPEITPSFCAGLSLGEYSALTAAKISAFEECLLVVDHRGQYMNEACENTKGKMAVVMGMEPDVVEKIVKEANLPHDLWVANFNCPGQIVISGTEKGVDVGSDLLKANGAKRVLPLSVHGAFHSGLMKEAQVKLSPYIQNMTMHKSTIGLIMNVEGALISDLDRMRHLLISQVTSSVRWQQGISTLMSEGVDLFIEIGCGKTLAGMNKRIGVSAPTISIEKIEDLEGLLA